MEGVPRGARGPPRPLSHVEQLLKEPGVFDSGSRSVSEARRVEKLRPDHTFESFDCAELNRYLQHLAWQNQQAGAAQTYIGNRGRCHHWLLHTCHGVMSHGGSTGTANQKTCASPRPHHTAGEPCSRSPLAGKVIGKAVLKDAIPRTL